MRPGIHRVSSRVLQLIGSAIQTTSLAESYFVRARTRVLKRRLSKMGRGDTAFTTRTPGSLPITIVGRGFHSMISELFGTNAVMTETRVYSYYSYPFANDEPGIAVTHSCRVSILPE